MRGNNNSKSSRKIAAVLAVTVPAVATAFAIVQPSIISMHSKNHPRRIIVSPSARVNSASTMRTHLLAAKKDEEPPSRGMEEAFRQLEELKDIDGDIPPLPERKKKQDEAFARAMQELNLKDIADLPEASIESEAELYKDMASELADKTETDMIDDLKRDLGGTPTIMPKFDPNTRDTEKFLEEALEQALADAERKAKTEINKESLLDNKEIMKEIEKIFDRASAELLEGIEEMRVEQMALAKESATRNAKQSQDRLDGEQERLAAAERNMKKMLEKVNQETRNVEMAIEDLKKVQADMEGGVDDQLMSLKSGGIVKQATLVGTLLFSLRSFVEGVAYLAGDATHLMPALIQGAIAVVCLIAFIFL